MFSVKARRSIGNYLASFSVRRLSAAATNRQRRVEDEGDWFYSHEWWGSNDRSTDNEHRVFSGVSDKGNGLVSVLAYPSSRPDAVYWPRTEHWLQQRYAQIYPDNVNNGNFKITGYQWRTLRFNDDTRQSTVKIMAAYMESDPGSICIAQQPHCLAVPYVKSMISAGLATISSCDFCLQDAVLGNKSMNILCIGHGGGSIPLFLASKIPGATVHIVEIDPLVISASVKAMGFPSFSVMASSGKRASPEPGVVDEVLWRGVHERLLLYEADAEKFILDNTNMVYDIVFVDAYDGEDIFPSKLWDPNSPFLKALGERIHPENGTVVVNLHSDVDLSMDMYKSSVFQVLPMGKYISNICRAYKDVLLGSGDSCDGLAYAVSVPWVCNTSLVVCRGLTKASGDYGWDMVLNTLVSKSLEVEKLLDLPFSCLQYIKRGFTIVN